MMSMAAFIIATAVKVTVVILAVLTGCAYSTWLERKLVGHFQHRIGPKLAGPYGLLQPVADGIKLIFKEDLVPNNAERITYALAPIIFFIPTLLTFAVIPFGSFAGVLGYQIDMVISDLNIGILYIFAITSLGVYGIVLAGWSSGSKYSLLGGIRSSAQMISYEVAYGLSIIGVLIIAGTLSMKELVAQQSGFFNWFIFRQPVGFVLYMICAIAETNRAPFDLPEAESELVAGYHTEYSSLRFAMFFIGEYANMIAVAAVAATLFFGGWHGPIFPPIVWFTIKVFCIMSFYIWLRATLPRLRYDQLMNLGWKILFPLALLNIMITALVFRL
jgi:NADH-quinone oxidoreductase subunit H